MKKITTVKYFLITKSNLIHNLLKYDLEKKIDIVEIFSTRFIQFHLLLRTLRFEIRRMFGVLRIVSCEAKGSNCLQLQKLVTPFCLAIQSVGTLD